MKKIFYSFIFLCIIIFPFFAITSPLYDIYYCGIGKKANYSFNGSRQTFSSCYVPTEDAGKKCSLNSECSSKRCRVNYWKYDLNSCTEYVYYCGGKEVDKNYDCYRNGGMQLNKCDFEVEGTCDGYSGSYGGYLLPYRNLIYLERMH